jgi:hypothetical protein
MYPKKIHINTDNVPKQRESMFPQPSIRSSRFERDLWNTGISSPSDSRRPSEQPDFKSTATKTNDDNVSSGSMAFSRQETERLGNISELQNAMWAKDDCQSSKSSNELEPIREHKLEMRDDRLPSKDDMEQKTVNPSRVEVDGASNEHAGTREASFINKIPAGFSQFSTSSSSQIEGGAPWRQTALERMTSPGATNTVLKPRRKPETPIIDTSARKQYSIEPQVTHAEETQELTAAEGYRPGSGLANSSQTTLDDVTKTDISNGSSTAWLLNHKTSGSRINGSFSKGVRDAENRTNTRDPATESSFNDTSEWPNHTSSSKIEGKNVTGEDWLINPDISTEQVLRKFPNASAPPSSRKSTTKILDQLPKDDLDFLSASEIRASMGHSKNQQDKHILRQKLEIDFQTAHLDDNHFHPMIESKILSDQYVRRKEKELLQSQKKSEARREDVIPVEVHTTKEGEAKTSHTSGEAASTLPQSGSVLDTSLDFMSEWLHTGGNVFAKHFWQEPIQEHSDAFEESLFKGILAKVQTGRRTMLQVKEDLANDIPASKALLSQLTTDEDAILSYRIYHTAAHTKYYDRVEKMRQALVHKDEAYKKACETVDSNCIKSEPSEALKRRLRLGADILQKNAKLTRLMIFGLQTRLGKPDAVGIAHRGRDLVQHVLALHDTQVTLSRLVERAMLAYGISTKTEEEVPRKMASNDAIAVDSSSVAQSRVQPTSDKGMNVKNPQYSAVAHAKLQDEVSAQVAAMRGLSDDGYSRSPKLSVRKSFDEPNPLAHSLFRPFGVQLESSGRDKEVDETETAKAEKKARADRELVEDVKKVYEDVHGPITVEHQQVMNAGEVLSSSNTDVVHQPEVPTGMPLKDAKMEQRSPTPPTIQLLKEDEISPAINQLEQPTIYAEDHAVMASKPATRLSEDKVSTSLTTKNQISSRPSEGVSTNNQFRQFSKEDDHHPNNLSDPEVNILKSEYTIYTYDAQSDEVVMTSTTSSATASKTEAHPVPLHEALAILDHPSKFLGHLPKAFEVITAKPDMLVVRSTTQGHINTLRVPATTPVDPDASTGKEESESWKGINPIDGMARLSPTGYVGNGLDLQNDFEERRKAAGEYHGRSIEEATKRSKRWPPKSDEKERKKVGVGGVMKTAIVAAATCYVVGVAAELVR